MIELTVFIGFAVVAAVIALYSFLERNSWMLSHIAASLVSTIILWVETLLFASGNVGTVNHVLTATEETTSQLMINYESIPPELYDTFAETSIVDTTYTYADVWMPILEPSLTFLLILFSAMMTVYTIMHVMTWLQERALGNEEEEDDE